MDLNPKTLAALTPTSLSIETDPFYKAKNPRFEGYAFDEVLAQIPGLSGIDHGRHSLRFVCADGYRTTFPFEAVENGHGLLATALLDHKDKTGDAWAPKLRGKSEQTPAPYYLVWAGETDLKARPWPYQLVSIEVLVDDALAAIGHTGLGLESADGQHIGSDGPGEGFCFVMLVAGEGGD